MYIIIPFTLEWATVFTDVKIGILIYNTWQVIPITLYNAMYIATL